MNHFYTLGTHTPFSAYDGRKTTFDMICSRPRIRPQSARRQSICLLSIFCVFPTLSVRYCRGNNLFLNNQERGGKGKGEEVSGGLRVVLMKSFFTLVLTVVSSVYPFPIIGNSHSELQTGNELYLIVRNV